MVDQTMLLIGCSGERIMVFRLHLVNPIVSHYLHSPLKTVVGRVLKEMNMKLISTVFSESFWADGLCKPLTTKPCLSFQLSTKLCYKRCVYHFSVFNWIKNLAFRPDGLCQLKFCTVGSKSSWHFQGVYNCLTYFSAVLIDSLFLIFLFIDYLPKRGE